MSAQTIQQQAFYEQDAAAPLLSSLKKGESGVVSGLVHCEAADQLAIKIRLLELGFAAGETVRVVAESFPRRDPMAVRLGNTTFALRRHEAALIQLERD
ncbi:MAG TPA: FeoA family protein [Burkholderiaceae bacterium]